MADFRKPAPEKEYIITERQLKNACDVITFHGQPMGAKDLGEEIRSRPYTSASSDVLDELEKRIDNYHCVANISINTVKREIAELRQQKEREQ